MPPTVSDTAPSAAPSASSPTVLTRPVRYHADGGDSYANSMLPFLINDFQEIKVLDLRYFTGSVKEILDTTEYKHVLILYGISTLNSDNSILNLKD